MAIGKLARLHEHYAIPKRQAPPTLPAGIVIDAVRRSQLRRRPGSARRQARGPIQAALAACVASCALLIAGCGESKQDAGEPSHTYKVAVTDVSFPARQAIARPTTLLIAVRNTSARTMPDVAVTVDSLTYRAIRPANLADPERPTWIVHQGPGPVANPPIESEEVTKAGGGQTASLHTWALGKLPPGQTKVFAWRLLPVVSGIKTVHYTIAAGLHGKAKATLAGGGAATGSFTVHIAPRPPLTHVNPQSGAVATGPYTPSTGPVGAVP